MFRDIKNFLAAPPFQRWYTKNKNFSKWKSFDAMNNRPRFLLSRPRWLFRKSNDRYWQRDIPDPFLRPKWNVINVDAEFATLKERTRYGLEMRNLSSANPIASYIKKASFPRNHNFSFFFFLNSPHEQILFYVVPLWYNIF